MDMVDKRRDYQTAVDAALDWLDDHQVHITIGVIQALARAMIDAVDDARNKRQQEH